MESLLSPPRRGKDGDTCGLLSTPEMNVENKSKDYPSISDYYKAAASGTKPIQYQHGLSNYSSVQLGDDRVSFKTSLSQDAYRGNMDNNGDSADNNGGDDDKNKIEKSYKERKAEYAEANSIVGLDKIHEMEQIMR